MKGLLKSSMLVFLLFLSLFTLVPKAYSLPFKQDSTIELNYASSNPNETAPVTITFSGTINEYQNAYYSVFFVLIGVNEGYRSVTECTITLTVGNFTQTKTATFTIKMLSSSIITFKVTISTTFLITLANVTSNDDLPFEASYRFRVTNFGYVGDSMSGTAKIHIPKEKPKLPPLPSIHISLEPILATTFVLMPPNQRIQYLLYLLAWYTGKNTT